ncbi:hypothetical protein [Aetokthonos hydrillicola]|nr:hypothetical protein [Aetokthonos hydrillicola]
MRSANSHHAPCDAHAHRRQIAISASRSPPKTTAFDSLNPG